MPSEADGNMRRSADSMRLGCSEMCLTGSLEDKLPVIGELGLWLELANIGKRDFSTLKSCEARVETVQAHQLHTLNWLSPTRAERKKAQRHVEETISVAEDVGAKQVLVVPAYGFTLGEHPTKMCIENLQRAAADTDLTMLVEPLSPSRTSFSPSPFEVADIVKETGCDNIRLALDTLHTKEAGLDPAEVLRRLGDSVAEVHLKDDGSRPPGTGSTDFKAVLKSCQNQLLCLEFKGTSHAEFRGSCALIRKILGETGRNI